MCICKKFNIIFPGTIYNSLFKKKILYFKCSFWFIEKSRGARKEGADAPGASHSPPDVALPKIG